MTAVIHPQSQTFGGMLARDAMTHDHDHHDPGEHARYSVSGST